LNFGQLGGALKNPLAVGAGMIEGMGYGINTMAERHLLPLSYRHQQDVTLRHCPLQYPH
jgi:hypothetical protein